MKHILAILMGIAILGLTVYLIVTNYVFVVRHVSVQLPDNSRFTPQQVALESGLHLGTRMDEIDVDLIARNLQDTGWLYLQDVVLQYPSGVQLVVEQRKPAALVSHVSTVIVTDANGIVIEQASGDPGYSNCVYVTDIDVHRAVPGYLLEASTDGKVDAMVALLQGFAEVPCQDLISFATLENPRNVRLYSTNHVWVVMGEGEKMADKLRWTEAALTDLIAKGEKLGTLNVVGGNHADYAPQQ